MTVYFVASPNQSGISTIYRTTDLTMIVDNIGIPGRLAVLDGESGSRDRAALETIARWRNVDKEQQEQQYAKLYNAQQASAEAILIQDDDSEDLKFLDTADDYGAQQG